MGVSNLKVKYLLVAISWVAAMATSLSYNALAQVDLSLFPQKTSGEYKQIRFIHVPTPVYVQVDRSIGVPGLPKSIVVAPDKIKKFAGAIGKVYTPSGRGSGFFISEDGLFLTNEHVVPKSECIQERCPGYKIVTGFYPGGKIKSYTNFERLVQNRHYDFALLKVNLAKGETVPYLKLALESPTFDASKPHVVLGHPHGAGLRYAIAKPIEDPNAPDDRISFLGLATKGNSGGPLLNLDTEQVIAVTTEIKDESVIVQDDSVYLEHLNYAVPIFKINKLVLRVSGANVQNFSLAADEPGPDSKIQSLGLFEGAFRRSYREKLTSVVLRHFMDLAGTKTESEALSLMAKKTDQLNGPIDLDTLNEFLAYGVGLGRPLNFDSKTEEDITDELRSVFNSNTYTYAYERPWQTTILFNYFKTIRSRFQKGCLDAFSNAPPPKLGYVLYNCLVTELSDKRSIFSVYAKWLKEQSGYISDKDFEEVSEFLTSARTMGTKNPEDFKALEDIKAYVSERAKYVRTRFKIDGLAFDLITGEAGEGSFRNSNSN